MKATLRETVGQRQCSAQAPGPSGWPQLPQGPIAAGMASFDAEPPTLPTTESCFSSAVEWQLGHSGTVDERTNASKAWPHCWQAYSKIGIVNSAGIAALSQLAMPAIV